jgi:hypothetical protein
MDDRKDLHASTFDQVLTRWDWLIQDLFLEARRARVSLQGSRFGARLVLKRATAFWWSNHSEMTTIYILWNLDSALFATLISCQRWQHYFRTGFVGNKSLVQFSTLV